MKPKVLLPYSIGMGVLAGVVTLVTWQANGLLITGSNSPLSFLAFCAWPAYFMIGATPKKALLAFSSMAFGILAAVAMFILAITFGFSPWWAVPLAVFIVVVFMSWLEKVPPAADIASVFLGTGLYFALSGAGVFGGQFTPANYLLVGVAELAYVLVGFVAGFLSIQWAGLCRRLFGDPA